MSKQFDYFIFGMVYFSLGAYRNMPESNITSPYIHLTKCWMQRILLLKGEEKIKLQN
ncbi:hypothetical protein [Chryseobacterium rhizosphaerae]|uniref:hypothetical protein n=1 Tax=Chryseobacterium rhizosphaerae TaxID=395937 RepID=UPI0013001D16|nr:hypothetical protein [Chryseobacterium rhizosphaerae]